MNTNTNCTFNGTGLVGTGYTTDIDGQNRLSPPDMGADEFDVQVGAGLGQWAGINTNWNDAANWCGAVPNVNTNVTIANGKPNYPIINTSNPVANGAHTVTSPPEIVPGVGGVLTVIFTAVEATELQSPLEATTLNHVV